MNRRPQAPWTLAAAALLGLGPAGVADQGRPATDASSAPIAAPGDSLALASVLALAKERNPRLQALRGGG